MMFHTGIFFTNFIPLFSKKFSFGNYNFEQANIVALKDA